MLLSCFGSEGLRAKCLWVGIRRQELEDSSRKVVEDCRALQAHTRTPQGFCRGLRVFIGTLGFL